MDKLRESGTNKTFRATWTWFETADQGGQKKGRG